MSPLNQLTTLAAACLLAAAVPLAADDKPVDEQAQLIEELVLHVGARDYRRRVKAGWILALIGEPSRGALKEAASGGDVEVSERVKEIVARLDAARDGKARPEITARVLGHLQGMDPIRTLDLSGAAKLEDRGLRPIRSLTQLRSLRLSGAQLGDGALDHLASLTELRALDLGLPHMTDGGVRHLTTLSRLEGLRLDGVAQLSDTGVAAIAELGGLKTLGIRGAPLVTDAGVRSLAKLTELEGLDLLVCTRVTDAGIAALVGLKKLARVRLVGCTEITDAGLRHLARLPALKYVSLYGCEGVTRAGVAWLKQQRPGCKVLR